MAKSRSQISRRNRQRGAELERETAAFLWDELGLVFKRNLEQVRTQGESDLLCEDASFPFALECKRRKSGNGIPAGAWAQAVEASSRLPLCYPCVIYKYDFRAARAVVSFSAISEALTGIKAAADTELADISMHGFCYLARELMAARAEQ